MKKLILVRHGSINVKERSFIGITDVTLSDKGRNEAKRAGMWVARASSAVSIYSSPLIRCRETAEIIAGLCNKDKSSIRILESLKEVDLGQWEGMTFNAVKEKYPEEFEKRGADLFNYRIPDAETLKEAGERFLRCISSIEDETDTVIIVAHKGVISSALCILEGRPGNTVFDTDLPHCGITVLIPEDGSFRIESAGETPWKVPSNGDINALYEKYGVPGHIRRHMNKVAGVVSDILTGLDPGGKNYDAAVMEAAALLHDIARTEKDHPKAGGEILKKEGYDLIGRIISEHNSPDMNPGYYDRLSEEDILYYADKTVLGESIVTVRQRFDNSLEKCVTDEAKANWNKRREKAVYIEKQITDAARRHKEENT